MVHGRVGLGAGDGGIERELIENLRGTRGGWGAEGGEGTGEPGGSGVFFDVVQEDFRGGQSAERGGAVFGGGAGGGLTLQGGDEGLQCGAGAGVFGGVVDADDGEAIGGGTEWDGEAVAGGGGRGAVAGESRG